MTEDGVGHLIWLELENVATVVLIMSSWILLLLLLLLLLLFIFNRDVKRHLNSDESRKPKPRNDSSVPPSMGPLSGSMEAMVPSSFV